MSKYIVCVRAVLYVTAANALLKEFLCLKSEVSDNIR